MEPAWEDELGLGARRDAFYFGDEKLRPLCELNASFVRLMVDSAARPSGEERPLLISALQQELLGLDAGAQARLAHCPVALLDMGFSDVDRWRAIRQPEAKPLALAHPERAGFPRLPATHLAQATLTWAWTLACLNMESACIQFGMSQATVREISLLGPQRILHIADHYSHWVRPRWESRTRRWQALLRMAAAPRASVSIEQYAIQCQLAERVLPAASAVHATGANGATRQTRG